MKYVHKRGRRCRHDGRDDKHKHVVERPKNLRVSILKNGGVIVWNRATRRAFGRNS